jgi:hypothetical protein
MMKMKNVAKILVWKSERKSPFRGTSRGWENIKLILNMQEVGMSDLSGSEHNPMADFL